MFNTCSSCSARDLGWPRFWSPESDTRFVNGPVSASKTSWNHQHPPVPPEHPQLSGWQDSTTWYQNCHSRTSWSGSGLYSVTRSDLWPEPHRPVWDQLSGPLTMRLVRSRWRCSPANGGETCCWLGQCLWRTLLSSSFWVNSNKTDENGVSCHSLLVISKETCMYFTQIQSKRGRHSCKYLYLLWVVPWLTCLLVAPGRVSACEQKLHISLWWQGWTF